MSHEAYVHIRDLRVEFRRDGQTVNAVNGVSFDVQKGEVMALIGESGSGKSVTLRALMRLHPPKSSVLSGTLKVGEEEVLTMNAGQLRRYRGARCAMIFQEPLLAFDPVYTVGQQIVEGLRRHEGLSRQAARERALEALRQVRIPSPERRLDAYPHEMSGGMRQRAMIALALSCNPQLLQELKRTLELTYVFISHDLHVVRWLSDRILVMYLGEVVEIGPAEQLFTASAHPYTRALLSSMPSMDPENRTLTSPLSGDPPSPIAPPSGCRFHTRCPHAKAVCAEVKPTLESVGEGHQSACLMAQPASPWHQSIPLKEVSHVG